MAIPSGRSARIASTPIATPVTSVASIAISLMLPWSAKANVSDAAAATTAATAARRSGSPARRASENSAIEAIATRPPR